MRISHQYRFVFLSNPRCASTSMRKLLDRYSDIKSEDRRPYYHHVTARDLREHFEKSGWNWDEYFRFTMIRNPWARMLSAYRYGRQNHQSVWHRIGQAAGSFPAFIHHPETFSENRGLKSLDRFAFDEEGTCLLNEIVKVEELDDRLPAILHRLKVPETSAPRINRTGSRWSLLRERFLSGPGPKAKETDRSYRGFYGEEERAIVARVFSSDIEYGGYEF